MCTGAFKFPIPGRAARCFFTGRFAAHGCETQNKWYNPLPKILPWQAAEALLGCGFADPRLYVTCCWQPLVIPSAGLCSVSTAASLAPASPQMGTGCPSPPAASSLPAGSRLPGLCVYGCSLEQGPVFQRKSHRAGLPAWVARDPTWGAEEISLVEIESKGERMGYKWQSGNK